MLVMATEQQVFRLPDNPTAVLAVEFPQLDPYPIQGLDVNVDVRYGKLLHSRGLLPHTRKTSWPFNHIDTVADGCLWFDAELGARVKDFIIRLTKPDPVGSTNDSTFREPELFTDSPRGNNSIILPDVLILLRCPLS